jgi:hypothetical protein
MGPEVLNLEPAGHVEEAVGLFFEKRALQNLKNSKERFIGDP